jgi:two-component system OmpR family sensor kinase
MFAKSIRLRFQLWLAFLLLAVLGGFGVTAYQLYRRSQLTEVDAQLERRVGSLAADVRGGPGGPGGPHGFGGRLGGPRDHSMAPPDEPFRNGPRKEEFRKGIPPDFAGNGEFHGPPPEFFRNREIRLSPRSQLLFDESDTNSFYFAIWSNFENLLKQSTNAPAGLARPALDRSGAVQTDTLGAFRVAYYFTGIGDCILVGHPIAELETASRHFSLKLFAAGAAVLFTGLGGGWLLTSRALQPIVDIGAAANRISGGDLSQRINVADTDSELGQLANLLNATFSRLETAFAQQKQFTADAAHELRTPLAVIISETQTTLARPRNAEEYRETVEACLETAQRMRALTHALLELARFDAGQEQIQKEPFDLAETARQSIADAETIAQERGVHLHADLQPTPANGDTDRIAQVISNLLANAIHYNKQDGEVFITTRLENGRAVLKVKDTGLGISAEALPHIFKRFYRADPSRTRGAGHSGLGLAISKAIIDAHQGTIAVESAIDEGTTFTVTI